MLKLTKSQQKFVTQRNLVQAVIKGANQTGKTAMGIGRLLYLVNHKCQQNEHILFVAADEVQAQKAQKLFNEVYHNQTMSLFETESPKVDIISVDALMRQLYTELCKKDVCEIIEEIPDKILQVAIMTVKKQYPRVKFLNDAGMAFICDELNWINSCGYSTLAVYSNTDRKGCNIKLPKGGKGRYALWAVKEYVDSALQAENKILKYVLQAQALEAVNKRREGYTHVIVDDCEKLTKVQLQVIRTLYKAGELLFLMDKNPCEVRATWLKRGQTFKQVGFDMTGRMRNLKAKNSQRSKGKKPVEVALTPLEMFIAELKHKNIHQVTEQKDKVQKKENNKVRSIEGTQMKLPIQVSDKLPWYVETYKYVNKLTGIETIFQKDTSAGETYIDEVKQEVLETLPLYTSDIAAGEPIEIMDEMSEGFEIPADLLNHKRDTYMLHVQGDSMIGADIQDGDYVVIQAGMVNNNEIAAVYYNGATTLKRIVQEEDHVLLVSENPKYRPIVIEDGDFRVMGKLIGVIKSISNF